MSESRLTKFNLEPRTFAFAYDCRQFVNKQKNFVEFEDSKQLVRSSGSVAANYIEANEALSKKDFVMRIKICRKEAKESILWLRLLDAPLELINEVAELMNIWCYHRKE